MTTTISAAAAAPYDNDEEEEHWVHILQQHSEEEDTDDEIEHYEPLYLYEGENWLQLTVPKGLQLLQDTQSQGHNNINTNGLPIPTIIWNSAEAPQQGPPPEVSNDCYICFDVDGTNLTIKDMRRNQYDDDKDFDDDDEMEYQLFLHREEQEPELLPKRQLRLLQKQDKLITGTNITDNTQATLQEHCVGLTLEYMGYKKKQELKHIASTAIAHQAEQLGESQEETLLLDENDEADETQRLDDMPMDTQHSTTTAVGVLHEDNGPATQDMDTDDDDETQAFLPSTQSPRKPTSSTSSTIIGTPSRSPKPALEDTKGASTTTAAANTTPTPATVTAAGANNRNDKNQSPAENYVCTAQTPSPLPLPLLPPKPDAIELLKDDDTTNVNDGTDQSTEKHNNTETGTSTLAPIENHDDDDDKTVDLEQEEQQQPRSLDQDLKQEAKNAEENQATTTIEPSHQQKEEEDGAKAEDPNELKSSFPNNGNHKTKVEGEIESKMSESLPETEPPVAGGDDNKMGHSTMNTNASTQAIAEDSKVANKDCSILSTVIARDEEKKGSADDVQSNSKENCPKDPTDEAVEDIEMKDQTNGARSTPDNKGIVNRDETNEKKKVPVKSVSDDGVDVEMMDGHDSDSTRLTDVDDNDDTNNGTAAASKKSTQSDEEAIQDPELTVSPFSPRSSIAKKRAEMQKKRQLQVAKSLSDKANTESPKEETEEAEEDASMKIEIGDSQLSYETTKIDNTETKVKQNVPLSIVEGKDELAAVPSPLETATSETPTAASRRSSAKSNSERTVATPIDDTILNTPSRAMEGEDESSAIRSPNETTTSEMSTASCQSSTQRSQRAGATPIGNTDSSTMGGEGESSTVSSPIEATTPSETPTVSRRSSTRKSKQVVATPPIDDADLRTPLSSRRSSARKRQAPIGEASAPKRARRASPRSAAAQAELEEIQSGNSQESVSSIGGRKRQQKQSVMVRILVTGIKVTSKHKSQIAALGAELLETTEDASRATHVIVSDGKETIRRTPKLMVAICYSSNIVTMKWLTDSAKQREILPTRKYLVLNDTVAEKKYNFRMETALQKGNQLRREDKTLLDDRPVFVCKGVAGNKAPSLDELKLIVDAAGGSWVSSNKELCKADPTKTLIITSDPRGKGQTTVRDVRNALNAGAKDFTTTWLFNCILSQATNGLS